MSPVGDVTQGRCSRAQLPVYRLRFRAKGDTFAVDAHLIHFAAVIRSTPDAARVAFFVAVQFLIAAFVGRTGAAFR